MSADTLPLEIQNLKVAAARLTATVDSNEEVARSRHAALVASLEQLKEATKCSHADKTVLIRWLREIITPQTVAILLAILASAVGAPMVASHLVGSEVTQAIEEAGSEDPAAPEAETNLEEGGSETKPEEDGGEDEPE